MKMFAIPTFQGASYFSFINFHGTRLRRCNIVFSNVKTKLRLTSSFFSPDIRFCKMDYFKRRFFHTHKIFDQTNYYEIIPKQLSEGIVY